MEYKSKSAGFLNTENAKDGDMVKIIEDAFETFSEARQQKYLNCKVELSDGSHKLASIDGNFGGDSFAELWGTETKDWVGHRARVQIKTSKAGNAYIVLVPMKGDLTPIEKPVEQTLAVEVINENDIPF